MTILDKLIQTKGAGATIIILSALSSILFWFGLSWLIKKRNLSANTAFLLFIATGFSIVGIVAGLLLTSHRHVRQTFSQDLQKLNNADWVLIVALPVLFIGIAYLTYKVFESENTLVGRFVPVRFALSVVGVAALGILVFQNQLSATGWIGITTLFIGSIILLLSKFF